VVYDISNDKVLGPFNFIFIEGYIIYFIINQNVGKYLNIFYLYIYMCRLIKCKNINTNDFLDICSIKNKINDNI
jgi:hypothetical protein